MLNNVTLVGRLEEDIKIFEEEQIKEMIISTQRQYKNKEGNYDTDLIKVILNGYFFNTETQCKKGDVVGVKGRIEGYEVKGDIVMKIIAEKITYLSSANE